MTDSESSKTALQKDSFMMPVSTDLLDDQLTPEFKAFRLAPICRGTVQINGKMEYCNSYLEGEYWFRISKKGNLKLMKGSNLPCPNQKAHII